jgi:tetratricopeptide (TPR) repeat protein
MQDGLHHARQAQQISEKLLAEFPAIVAYKLNLADHIEFLGWMLQGTGSTKEAANSFRAALEVREQLVASFPDTAVFAQLLGRNYRALGANLQADRKQQEADKAFQQGEKAFQRSINLWAKLLDKPDGQEPQVELGDLLRSWGRTKRAQAAYRHAFEILRPTMATPHCYRSMFRRVATDLIEVCKSNGDRQEEGKFRMEAIAVYQKLAEAVPGSADDRIDLAATYESLAALLKDMGQMNEAEKAYRNALALRQKLATDFPTNPRYRDQLANRNRALASWLSSSK